MWFAYIILPTGMYLKLKSGNHCRKQTEKQSVFLKIMQLKLFKKRRKDFNNAMGQEKFNRLTNQKRKNQTKTKLSENKPITDNKL
jgi:hypothetical protein